MTLKDYTGMEKKWKYNSSLTYKKGESAKCGLPFCLYRNCVITDHGNI